jgi:hypothetical protein
LASEPLLRKPSLFAKFVGDDIFGEQGRLLFSLLNAFVASGYSVELFDSLPAERVGKYALMAKSLPGVEVASEVPHGSANMFYLFDHEDRDVGGRAWLKKIRVRFDIFSSLWLRHPLLLPFPVHPVHAAPDLRERLSRLRRNSRNLRAFFSGETLGYTSSRITYPRRKLSRLEVLGAVREGMGEHVIFVQHADALDRLLSGAFVDKCVILDTSKFRVPDRDWLDVLSRCDFFLSPPGIVMPMCHNAVEALAVGAIPIINYPEWFDPNLEHMSNCIAFDDQQDLVAKLALALAADVATVATMRERAIQYYDAHLSSESFIAKIEARPERKLDVLMIVEEYVRKNASRLSSRSVLIRGRGVR